MAIIAISGKIGSGKDTIGGIIQYLVYTNNHPDFLKDSFEEWKSKLEAKTYVFDWEIKKFADKLKDIVCLLIGCTREQLEDHEFKNTELGEEWWKYKSLHHSDLGRLVQYQGNLSKATSQHWKLVKLTPRLLLQLIGTECGRNIIHPNLWVNALFNGYSPAVTYQMEMLNLGASDLQREKIGKPVHAEYPNWIITDMRFTNELEAVKEKRGISIRINRPWVDKKKEDQVIQEHPSETALDNAEFDYVIYNTGTIEDLIEDVKGILIQENII